MTNSAESLRNRLTVCSMPGDRGGEADLKFPWVVEVLNLEGEKGSGLV